MPQRITSAIRSDKLRQIYRAAVEQGFEAVVDGNGHVRLQHPTTGKRFWISTTKDGGAAGRGFQNTKSNARKAGLKI